MGSWKHKNRDHMRWEGTLQADKLFQEGNQVIDEGNAEWLTLTDNSIANTLHRHSELVASDGSPDPALSVDATGNVGIGTGTPTLIDSYNRGTHTYGQYPAMRLQRNTGVSQSFQWGIGGDDNLHLGMEGNANVADVISVNSTTGNVGIGTGTPNTKLEISGATGANYLRLNNTVTGHSQHDILSRIEFYNNDPSDYGPNVAGIIEATADGSTGGGCAIDIKTRPTSEGNDAASTLYIGQTGTIEHKSGDFFWSGSGSGLPYGCIEGTDETITCTNQNQWYQVTFDNVGSENLMTGNTTTNDIIVGKTGVYNVRTTCCFHSNPSNDFEVQIKTENGTVDFLHLFQTTAVANKVENTAGTCIIPLTATDTLELWVRCTSAAGQDAVFDHCNLTAVMVGG